MILIGFSDSTPMENSLGLALAKVNQLTDISFAPGFRALRGLDNTFFTSIHESVG